MEAWSQGQSRWLRDLADPPILRQFREQQNRWARDLSATPAFQQIRKQQQQWMREFIDPPVLRQLREQQQRWARELTAAPALRQVREQQQQWIRHLADPTLLRQIREQQQRLSELVSSSALADIAAWQLEFSGRLEGVAKAIHETSETELSGDDVALALGFQSAKQLIWALEASVKGLAILAGSMGLARAAVGLPVSDGLLYAIVTWIAVSTLAIHLVSGPPEEKG
jgi:hypothetical protein